MMRRLASGTMGSFFLSRPESDNIRPARADGLGAVWRALSRGRAKTLAPWGALGRAVQGRGLAVPGRHIPRTTALSTQRISLRQVHPVCTHLSSAPSRAGRENKARRGPGEEHVLCAPVLAFQRELGLWSCWTLTPSRRSALRQAPTRAQGAHPPRGLGSAAVPAFLVGAGAAPGSAAQARARSPPATDIVRRHAGGAADSGAVPRTAQATAAPALRRGARGQRPRSARARARRLSASRRSGPLTAPGLAGTE